MSTDRLLEEAKRWGVLPGYEDASGVWQESPRESIEAALEELKRVPGLPVNNGSHSMRARCFVPRRAWGWSLQLPSIVSGGSQGMGDLVDLRYFGQRARKLGAGFVVVSPLGANLPFGQQQPSPYFRSSRCFLDPLYLRLPERPLPASDPIDRDRVLAWKMPRLKRAYAGFDNDPDFEVFLEQQGEELRRFALFQALSEDLQQPWTQWPAGLRDPVGPKVRKWSEEHPDQIRFHCWVQWQIDQQLKDAATPLDLVVDLPVGADPQGAESWAWQSVMASGFRVGAPPDAFNTQGQDWGVVPFHPVALTASDYSAFRFLIQANMRNASGLRIDHVMGLFRLFWIPEGATPKEGVYVRYPHRDLLGIVAEESERTQTFVVGEDLGTVEPEVRVAMEEAGVLGYRVFWFEDDLKSLGGSNLATVTTHDLPTVEGVWTGSDEREQLTLGLNPGDMQSLKDRLNRVIESPGQDPVVAAYTFLAKVQAPLVAVALEDALGVEQRPNMPGTLTERPNWSTLLPVALEELFEQPMVKEMAQIFAEWATPR